MRKADVTGSGGPAGGKLAAPDTAESWPPSRAVRRGKRNTGSGLGVRERLQIFQQALVDLAASGILVQVANHNDGQRLILALGQVRLCGGCQYLRLMDEMVGEMCQYCVDAQRHSKQQTARDFGQDEQD